MFYQSLPKLFRRQSPCLLFQSAAGTEQALADMDAHVLCVMGKSRMLYAVADAIYSGTSAAFSAVGDVKNSTPTWLGAGGSGYEINRQLIR